MGGFFSGRGPREKYNKEKLTAIVNPAKSIIMIIERDDFCMTALFSSPFNTKKYLPFETDEVTNIIMSLTPTVIIAVGNIYKSSKCRCIIFFEMLRNSKSFYIWFLTGTKIFSWFLISKNAGRNLFFLKKES